MKKLKNIILCTAAAALLLNSCIEETEPMGGSVTDDQVAQVPSAVLSFSTGLESWMNNWNTLGRDPYMHYDFGYPALMLTRDMLGQDMVYPGVWNQLGTWYGVTATLGPDYIVCQLPWRWYYKLIFNTNTIIGLVPDPATASDKLVVALGKAYFYRAFAYFDLGRLYLKGSYANNPQGLTVPKVTLETVDASNNPRIPADQLYAFVLEDLGKAADYLANAPTHDKSVPTLSAVHGMMARVYLEIGDWGQAEFYAKEAQTGFTPLTETEWLDRTTGFNTPANAWIWCTATTTTNDNVVRTGLCNWISHMAAETDDWGYNGLPANDLLAIDRHLYDQIGSGDFRKKSYIDPAAAAGEIESDLAATFASHERYHYVSIKFRPGGGLAGFAAAATGACAAVPLMRVEEMMLIEAEAAARQDANRGKTLLETFVKTYRNPVYASSASGADMVVNDIWIQRRIELWGEGFATFDIKRLNRGITRSYTGTNHRVGFRFNTATAPAWMDYCIVRTEFNNNFAIKADENNPAPITPSDAAPAW